MDSSAAGRLKPRKVPSQQRSKATVEAILEATVQVLLREGAVKLTTRRIADRAGVSIGTVYQYAPGKEALLYALVSRQLDLAVGSVELVCRAAQGHTLAQCSDAFVAGYVDAKAAEPDMARALYHATSRLDMTELVEAAVERLERAARDLLASASDARIENLDEVAFCWVTTVVGATRRVFEGADSAARLPAFRSQLLIMSRAYLEAAGTREPG